MISGGWAERSPGYVLLAQALQQSDRQCAQVRPTRHDSGEVRRHREGAVQIAVADNVRHRRCEKRAGGRARHRGDASVARRESGGLTSRQAVAKLNGRAREPFDQNPGLNVVITILPISRRRLPHAWRECGGAVAHSWHRATTRQSRELETLVNPCHYAKLTWTLKLRDWFPFP